MTLSAMELRQEREASVARQRARIEPALARVRALLQEPIPDVVEGGLPISGGRRNRYRTVVCPCGTSFHQKKGLGRPAKWCLDCRAELIRKGGRR